jgi:hypothetical protein
MFAPGAPAVADHAAALRLQQGVPPLSPLQLSAHGAGGSIPHSPLLLSPQQPRLGAAASPSAPPVTLPFLHSPVQAGGGLAGPLGDLPLGSPSQHGAGLDLANLAAFQQHLQHAAPPPFSNGGATGGLPFGGSSLLSGFGGLPAAQAGFAGGSLSLGGGGGGSLGGGLDDWAELQQQLPSDLGAMLGADPSLSSPHQSPLKPAGGQQEGAEGGGLYGSAAAHWF